MISYLSPQKNHPIHIQRFIYVIYARVILSFTECLAFLIANCDSFF